MFPLATVPLFTIIYYNLTLKILGKKKANDFDITHQMEAHHNCFIGGYIRIRNQRNEFSVCFLMIEL